MNYRKNVMAMPCRGRFEDLDVRWDAKGRLGAAFKLIGEDGSNVSELACAKLLPWELFEGSMIEFEVGEMYAVAGCKGLLVRVRELDDGDHLFEAGYSPKLGQPDTDPVEAVSFLGTKLHQLAVIDEADVERFRQAVRQAPRP